MTLNPLPYFNFTRKVLSLIVVLSIPAICSFSQISDEDLILYMPFNGNVNDESGYENNGTLYGATLTEDRFGNSHSAFFFDGQNDYIEVQPSESLNSISGFLTMSAWVKPMYQYYNAIVSKGSQNFFMDLVQLRPGFIYKGLEIDYSGAENYWERILLNMTIPEDSWTHILSTYDGARKRINIYINGELKHSCTAQGSIISGDDKLGIGARIFEKYPEFFHGSLDDIRIYSKALNETEVSALYNEQVCINNITVYDTVTVYNSIGVNDTLFINFEIPEGVDHKTNKIIKVYVNPTNDVLTIDANKLKGDDGLRFKIINNQSQVLFESKINLPEYNIDLYRFENYGIYQIIILNSKNELLALKKIVIQ